MEMQNEELEQKVLERTKELQRQKEEKDDLLQRMLPKYNKNLLIHIVFQNVWI